MDTGYHHQRGTHCGSTALRNLLAARGLALSEPKVFGLGAGLGFSLHDGAREVQPPLPERFFVGRSLAYEEELVRAIGATLEVLRFDSAGDALEEARARAARGDALLAFTDLFHLPYLGARGHWFGHLVALDHLDETQAWVGDNERDSLEPVPLDSLARALCAASPAPSREKVQLAIHGVHPLSREELRAACGRAIDLQREQLARGDRAMQVWRGGMDASGREALERLPEEIRSWRGAPDLARRLRFAGQVIEVRGNGGGLFRLLYAAFLREADALGVSRAGTLLEPVLRAADAWTALALELERLRILLNERVNHLDRNQMLANPPAAQEVAKQQIEVSDDFLDGAVALAGRVRDAELALLAA